MIIFCFCAISVTAFLLGYVLGFTKKAEPKIKGNTLKDARAEQIIKEFENFLNYDGSEQL